jgi:hypothetical protein
MTKTIIKVDFTSKAEVAKHRRMVTKNYSNTIKTNNSEKPFGWSDYTRDAKWTYENIENLKIKEL